MVKRFKLTDKWKINIYGDTKWIEVLPFFTMGKHRGVWCMSFGWLFFALEIERKLWIKH